MIVIAMGQTLGFSKKQFERDSNSFFANIEVRKAHKRRRRFPLYKEHSTFIDLGALPVNFPSRQLPNNRLQVKKENP